MNNSLKRNNILIVDDDPQIHKLIGKMLPQDRFCVQSAYAASEAINVLDHSKPDLIVLDIMMPNVSGFEVLTYIRKNPDFSNILILILSAKDGQHDRLDGLIQGADDYVAKPFHIKHLIRKIEHMLEKRNLSKL